MTLLLSRSKTKKKEISQIGSFARAKDSRDQDHMVSAGKIKFVLDYGTFLENAVILSK